jgi:shikimate dehydrogenase
MVLSYLDMVSDGARKAAAINTVLNDQGRLVGHNTDGQGFIRALREEASFSPRGKRALILGAGGAARGVAMALAEEEVLSFVIANRTMDRAKRLAKDLKRHWKADVKVIPLGRKELAKGAQDVDLIVHCSTMGMWHGPNEAGTPLEAEDIPSEALVYDLVYNPPKTPLMREAEIAGAQVLGGLSMLIYQGAIAFELWTGKKAPVEVMFKAARQALATRTN